jgi:tetratricopeptide (TPR) repeat protein
VSHDDVVKGLDEIGRRYREYGWLAANSEYLYHVIHTGLYLKSPVHEDAIWALFTISQVMLTSDDFRRWTLLLCDALGVVISGTNDNDRLMQLYNLLGQGYMLNRDVDTARQMFDTVFERVEESATAERANEIMLLAYVGLIRTEMYDYSHAFGPQIVQKALAIAKRLKDPLLTAWLYQALGGAHGHRGESEQALGYSMSSLAYWHQRQHAFEIAKTGLTLAISFRKAALLRQARQTLRLAQSYIQRTDNTQYKTLITYEQGVLDYYAKNFDDAETLLEEAYEGFRLLDWPHHLTMTSQMIGMVLMELGKCQEAETRLLRTMGEWRRMGNLYEQASTLYELGRLAKRRGDPDAERDYFGQALAICRKLPMMPASEQLEQLILAAPYEAS